MLLLLLRCHAANAAGAAVLLLALRSAPPPVQSVGMGSFDEFMTASARGDATRRSSGSSYSVTESEAARTQAAAEAMHAQRMALEAEPIPM